MRGPQNDLARAVGGRAAGISQHAPLAALAALGSPAQVGLSPPSLLAEIHKPSGSRSRPAPRNSAQGVSHDRHFCSLRRRDLQRFSSWQLHCMPGQQHQCRQRGHLCLQCWLCHHRLRHHLGMHTYGFRAQATLSARTAVLRLCACPPRDQHGETLLRRQHAASTPTATPGRPLALPARPALPAGSERIRVFARRATPPRAVAIPSRARVRALLVSRWAQLL